MTARRRPPPKKATPKKATSKKKSASWPSTNVPPLKKGSSKAHVKARSNELRNLEQNWRTYQANLADKKRQQARTKAKQRRVGAAKSKRMR